MTDNKVYVDQNGNEMVMVNRSDGLGVSEIKKLGIKQLIISTEKNPVVSKRAEKINIPYIQGVEKKEKYLLKYCNDKNIDIKDVAFIGNDLNDLKVMEVVGLPMCPSDSAGTIKKISKIVLQSAGGEGIVREILSLI